MKHYATCKASLLCSITLFLAVQAPKVTLAECGPWDGTPYCVRNGALGVTSTRLNRFSDGYSVCYHGEGKRCQGGAWVGDLKIPCLNKPDTRSPAQTNDQPCTAGDEGDRVSAQQTGADPTGNMGTSIGTPIGAAPVPADLPPPTNASPAAALLPSFGMPGRTPTRGGEPPAVFQTGGANAAACSQLQNQIQQIEANCVAMSSIGKCSDPRKLSLIQQLQAAFAQCR